MDWQGSYGWRPFLPWSGTWYYLDWVAIVDPFFWLVPLVALAWGAERHWIPLTAAVVVGGAITVLLVRTHELVATWVLGMYAIVCVVAVSGWIGYWFGPVGRQRAATLALLLLVVYTGAQAAVAGSKARNSRRGPAALRQRGVLGGAHQYRPARLRGRRCTRAPTRSRAMTGSSRGTCAHPSCSARSRRRRGPRDGSIRPVLAAEVDTTDKAIYLWDARYARGSHDGWAVVKIRME